jgi:hypothetical protein
VAVIVTPIQITTTTDSDITAAKLDWIKKDEQVMSLLGHAIENTQTAKPSTQSAYKEVFDRLFVTSKAFNDFPESVNTKDKIEKIIYDEIVVLTDLIASNKLAAEEKAKKSPQTTRVKKESTSTPPEAPKTNTIAPLSLKQSLRNICNHSHVHFLHAPNNNNDN